MGEEGFNDAGVHEACGHATEAHGPEGCLQPGCGCDLVRIVAEPSANSQVQNATVEAPAAEGEGTPTE